MHPIISLLSAVGWAISTKALLAVWGRAGLGSGTSSADVVQKSTVGSQHGERDCITKCQWVHSLRRSGGEFTAADP